jgi:uncharacterized protein (TIGR00369 family)
VTQPTDRTRTFSWSDPLATAATLSELNGLDAMRAVISGELPPPPIADMLGMELVHADRGHVIFRLQPQEFMYNPIGSVHGGIAATMLDSALGCSIHTTLDAGVGYTTSDLQIRYVRAISLGVGPVLAESRVIHEGRRLATAEGRLYAQEGGKLFAHGSTSCLILS